jgi:hypothetical protein
VPTAAVSAAAAACDEVRAFKLLPGRTASRAATVITKMPSTTAPKSLAERCLETPGCIAFDTSGNLMSYVELRAVEPPPKGPPASTCAGVYVGNQPYPSSPTSTAAASNAYGAWLGLAGGLPAAAAVAPGPATSTAAGAYAISTPAAATAAEPIPAAYDSRSAGGPALNARALSMLRINHSRQPSARHPRAVK